MLVPRLQPTGGQLDLRRPHLAENLDAICGLMNWKHTVHSGPTVFRPHPQQVNGHGQKWGVVRKLFLFTTSLAHDKSATV